MNKKGFDQADRNERQFSAAGHDQASCKCVAISPAHNEEKLIGNLIDSIRRQSVRPRKWIIIDDGSTDSTSAIIDDAAQLDDWIVPVHLPKRTHRAAGGESIVMQQLSSFPWREFDYVFRVDADVTVGDAYVEQLLHHFEADPRLGIASGTLYEPVKGEWKKCIEPLFQATGNCRIYSTKCLEAIGEIKNDQGWDTIDVSTAMMLGFHTRNFRDLPVFHHRPTQTANGRLRGRLNIGEAAYNAGYSVLFMMVRSIYRTFSGGNLTDGLFMMLGYLRCWIQFRPKLADPAVVRFVRKQQLRRLLGYSSQWQ